MDRDFKIGMICGAVLASVALLWVVTRPTLTTQARMLSPSAAASQETPRDIDSLLSEQNRIPSDTAADPRPAADDMPPATPAGLIEPSGPVETAAEQTREPEPDLTIYEQDEKITTTRFHIVQKNETLSGISQQYYGTANRWREILKANEQTIPDANKIRPGTKLVIP